jgi:hypothetical protein
MHKTEQHKLQYTYWQFTHTIQLQEKICKSTGAKPLYSEETQISLFKSAPVQGKICCKEVTGFLMFITAEQFIE